MTQSLHTLIHYLRRCTARPDEAALTDAQLLQRWTQRRDAAAFELLLWRHGPMVLRTCRRLLPQSADAEDAFQATFIVLLRKANLIRRGETLAAWLHRVASRVALRARAARANRMRQEQPLIELPAAAANDEASVRDLHTVLDEEIDRLPARYRRAVILCCLQGKSQEEVAQLLACPRGTVSSWLTRGRERLRQRLLRRGIVVSIAGLTAAVAPEASVSGMMPLIAPLLHIATGKGALSGLMSSCSLALAERMLRAMFMTKVKIAVTLLLTATVFAVGIGTLSYPTQAANPFPLPAKDEDRAKKPDSTKKGISLPQLQDIQPGYSLTLRVTDSASSSGIAWGKAAHGLQAGIGFRPGDQETSEIGQSVTFVVYLRNVSERTIVFRHSETLFAEQMPRVEDTDGIRVAVAPGPINLGRIPFLERKLEPGQWTILGYPWFRLRPLDWRGTVVSPTCSSEPGSYKVSYTSFPLRLNGDKADVSIPSTETIDLRIRKTETTKADKSGKEMGNATPSSQDKKSAGIRPLRMRVGESKEVPRLYLSSSRSFDIPFLLRPECQKEITTLVLLVSRDEGKKWRLVDQKQAEAKKFSFTAPEDGEYWFYVQEVPNLLGGRVVGVDEKAIKPMLKVRVKTLPPSELHR